jgi:hypothetical protein
MGSWGYTWTKTQLHTAGLVERAARRGTHRLLAESFASLQPMKSVNEDKSLSVAANKDRGFLPNLQHALSDLADSFRPECAPSFHRDIDFSDWEALTLAHGPHLFGRS